MMPAESVANVIDRYGEGSMAATSGDGSDDRPPGRSLLHTVYLMSIASICGGHLALTGIIESEQQPVISRKPVRRVMIMEQMARLGAPGRRLDHLAPHPGRSRVRIVWSTAGAIAVMAPVKT